MGLDETGFYIEEEKQFNGVFACMDEISLDTEKILDTNVRNWDEFCTALYITNSDKIETQNSIWKRGMEHDKLTTFGLDIVPVPGTPKEYVIKR